MLPEKKGIEKNLWAKKFIKNIQYSKSEISISLYYSNICDLHTPAGRQVAGFGAFPSSEDSISAGISVSSASLPASQAFQPDPGRIRAKKIPNQLSASLGFSNQLRG